LYGDFVAEVSPRHVSIQLLARAAAATDPEAAGALHEEGHFRSGVSMEEARDLLWSHNSPELYDLLVLQRGWPPERYGRWLAASLTAALLPR
jgi:hypothetical protein